MSQINANVRWADNTEQLRKNLLSGIDSLTAMKGAVDRTATAMGGTGLLAAANKTAAAIQQIGGITKLTAAEQDRANALLDKAVEKYRALGVSAPSAIRDISSALKEAKESTTGWSDVLGELGHSWAASIAEGILLRDAIHEVIDKVKEMIGLLPEIALKGAAVADVEDAFKRLTDQSGRLGDTLMGELRTGTHNTVTDFELMKTANQDLTAGMNLTDKQFGTLAKGAFALAQATGGDVKTALDTMNDAMLTGRTRSLALLTGKLNLTAAEESFAKGLLSTADHLTEEGKLEAARAAILQAVGAATERLGEQTDGLDERVAQASTAFENFKENLGKTIATSAVLEAGMSGLKDAITSAVGPVEQQLIDEIAKKVDDLAIGLVEIAKVGVESAGFVAKEWSATKVVFGDIIQIVDGVRLALLLTQQAASIGLLPGTADLVKWKALDDQIAHLEVTMKQRGDALQADKAAEADVDAATARYGATLDGIIAKMTAVRDAGTSLSKTLSGVMAAGQENFGTSAMERRPAAPSGAGPLLGPSKSDLAKAKQAQEEYVKNWEKTDDEVQKIWGEAFVASAAIDQKSIAGQLAVLEQKRVNEENAATLRIAETTKSEDQLGQLVLAIRAKYAALEDAAIQADTEKNIEESRAAGLAAAAAVSKAFSGPQPVLKDFLVSTGAIPISLKSILTPMQELGHVMTDVTISGKEHFDDLNDAITGDFTNIIATMKEHGVQTRSDLQLTADKFKAEYQAMAASGKFTADELVTAWARYRQAVATAHPELLLASEDLARLAGGVGAVTSALAPIGNISPMFGALDTAVGGVAHGMKDIGTAMASAATSGFNASNLSELAAGWIGVAVAIYQAIDALEKYLDASEKERASIEYAKALGLEFDSATGFARTLTDQINAQGEALAITLAQLDKYKGKNTSALGKDYAEALNLPQLIDALGGYSAALSSPELVSKTQILFDVIKEGGVLAVQGVKTLDTVLAGMGEAGAENGGVVSQAFHDMVEHARELGIVLPEVTKFFQGQATALASGLSDLLTQPLIDSASTIGKAVTDATKAYDDLKTSGKASSGDLAKAQQAVTDALSTQHQEAERDKQALDDLGTTAITAFNAAIASGSTFVQALQAIAPALATIQQAYKDLGLTIDDVTLKGLELENTILNGTKDAPSSLGKAISGLQQIVTAAMNLGKAVETPEALKGQQGNLASLYNQAQAASANAGVTGAAGTAAALLPFQQTLHELQKWASDHNEQLDENTQRMIDQSQELGVWTDDVRTDGEKTRDSITDLIKSNDDLAAALGALPGNLQNVLSGAGGSTHASTGGIVYAADGWGPPIGTDTVKAYLTPGESVLTRSATDSIGAGTIAAWNSGSYAGFLKGDQLGGGGTWNPGAPYEPGKSWEPPPFVPLSLLPPSLSPSLGSTHGGAAQPEVIGRLDSLIDAVRSRSGNGSGGGDVTLIANFSGLGVKDIAQFVETPEFANAFVRAAHHNLNGLYTGSRAALQIRG